MAANKTNKQTSKRSKSKGEQRQESALRLEVRLVQERRYIPRTSLFGSLSLVALLVSGVLPGRGSTPMAPQLRRRARARLAGTYLLLGGVLLLGLVTLVGSRSAKACPGGRRRRWLGERAFGDGGH